ncbi:unnamed protein product [Fraxinus pennsylvanica]|uniref:Uncharacterized protein n=1 Tax=Fraxinus pennsylvanica TaxID=56036 RepID=A0AAD2DRP5_9LAMI|nr:unnamed protein product [Fraxinus pennsylvanica]
MLVFCAFLEIKSLPLLTQALVGGALISATQQSSLKFTHPIPPLFTKRSPTSHAKTGCLSPLPSSLQADALLLPPSPVPPLPLSPSVKKSQYLLRAKKVSLLKVLFSSKTQLRFLSRQVGPCGSASWWRCGGIGFVLCNWKEIKAPPTGAYVSRG